MNHQRPPLRPLKNFNEHVIKYLIIALGVGMLIVAVLTACQKESSFTSRELIIEKDHDLKPADGWNTVNRPANYAEMKAGGNGKGKGKPVRPPKDPEPPTDTTNPDPENPPPPSTGAVIYLDFDGQYLVGSIWNVQQALDLKPSNQTPEEQASILARVQSDYAFAAVTITTDSSQYWNAPVNKRMRVIITESWEWYTQAGGVAYMNSFSWGDNTPCFVFNGLLGYSVKFVSDATTHEIGHTLGLYHVPQRDASGNIIGAYATYGNHLGAGYYVDKPFFEENVQDSRNIFVNQYSVITNSLNK
jgi:hypothetical protein